MQLEVDKEAVVMADESWQATQDGPVAFNDIQLGERVDARKVLTAFHSVKVEEMGCDTMLCTNSVPVLEKEQFLAKLIKTPDGGRVLDFGQNMSAYVSFRFQAKAGQKIKMTHGEYLDGSGNYIAHAVYSDIRQTSTFTCDNELVVPDIAMAYYAYSSKMMADIAGVLGRMEDAAHYKQLAANSAKAEQWFPG